MGTTGLCLLMVMPKMKSHSVSVNLSSEYNLNVIVNLSSDYNLI